MSHGQEPSYLLVRARGHRSPLSTESEAGAQGKTPEDFTRLRGPDDPELGLPSKLAEQLTSWSRHAPDQTPERQRGATPEVRRHAKEGLALARQVARRLGPRWVVSCWDESHRTAKFVCWGCDRLHWSADEHGDPPHPVQITVEGEFKWFPLRAEGFGDFAPDDPAAGLVLPDDLVADFYQWAKDIDAGMNQYLRDRDEAADDARRAELHDRGQRLSDRLSHEVGAGRSVTYAGLA